jgi:diacylglycerol kinase family enzyme
MYTSVTIIFNPNSTGDSPRTAHTLADKLHYQLKGISVRLQKTKHAGHAEELAYDAAMKGKEPLIISVSGDGGYHEVVNGAMRAAEAGATPICGVMAAGNANDHRRLVKKRPLVEAILEHDISRLDVLEVKWDQKHRYAHSYVGLGLTPVVAVELNRHTLSSLKELFLVIKTYWKYQPHTLEIDGKRSRFDSLVLGNISGMAKVLELSEDGNPADGKFEVVAVPHRNRLSVLGWAIKSATIGAGKQPQTDDICFTAIEPMPMQLDGEVVKLAAGTTVQVTIAHKALRTVR